MDDSRTVSEELHTHRLQPLLRPRRIALVGASAKPGTVGRGMITSATMPGTPADVFLINPNYDEIDGRPCFAGFDALPEPIDLAVLGVANARLEASLADAIRAGVKAAAIFASGYLESDTDPKLTARLSAMAREAGLAICGGNCMGFYNMEYGLRVCGFPPPDWMRAGNVAFITHSGSAFSALCHNDRRLAFNLAVSAGQELATTVADYMDYALDQASTRAIALFLEAVRDPTGFVAALERAGRQNVPVIALKVGRNAESAALAVSHSGAVAGNHAAYRALFDRYNVVEVDNMDDLVNSIRFYAGDRELAPGGIATMHDSGGFRELAMDLAIEHKVPFAKIASATREKLAARLDFGLEPINPLDAWGTGADWEGIFEDCLQALVDDPDTAVAALCVETRDGYTLTEGYCDILRRVRERTNKPVILTTNVASNGSDVVAVRLVKDGVQVLSGVDSMLRVIAKAMARRDRLAGLSAAGSTPNTRREHWINRLEVGGAFDEAEGLAMLADYGIATLPHRIADEIETAVAAARDLGYPVVLKTATPGIQHKSDVGGVKLRLGDEAALRTAYADVASRLGPRVLVMKMAAPGVEISFGMTRDPQFGAVVMIGAGGTLIELLSDRRFALAPLNPANARRHIDTLALRPLLDGKRGAAPADIAAVAGFYAKFSVLAAELGDHIAEMDVNPLIAGPDGCVAIDSLIVPRKD